MSLTSLLKDPAMRHLFDTTFKFQPRHMDAKILASPSENRPAVGMAFNYLARFWLKYQHKDAVTYPWQAEYGVLKLQEWASKYPQCAVLAPIAREWLASAKSEYEAYLCSGDLTDGLLRATIRLAKIDAVHRGGIVTGIGVEPTEGDVDDLRALWGVMLDGDLAGLRTPMYLNPEFGEATDLVHGADANIIADDILVQIKTIKKPTFKLEHFRQLAGYVTLQKLAGGRDFREVGVYLARHGQLLTVGADIIYEALDFETFLEKFRQYAEDEFGPLERSNSQPPVGFVQDASG